MKYNINLLACFEKYPHTYKRLAKFYLSINQYRVDKLLTFNGYHKKDESSLLFLLAFGGDGAPGVGTVFSVSFLNIGKRILSSSGTFMLFGGDVEVSSVPVVMSM